MEFDEKTFTEVGDKELESGIEYASCEYGIDLDRDMLRTIANKTGYLRLRDSSTLHDARYRALREHLSQRDKRSAVRYRAYSAAVGHIFGRRNAYRTRALTRRQVKRPETQNASSNPFVILGADNQFELKV